MERTTLIHKSERIIISDCLIFFIDMVKIRLCWIMYISVTSPVADDVAVNAFNNHKCMRHNNDTIKH